MSSWMGSPPQVLLVADLVMCPSCKTKTRAAPAAAAAAGASAEAEPPHADEDGGEETEATL